MSLFLPLLLLLSPSVRASSSEIPPDRGAEVARSRQWLRILEYSDGKSRVDGSGFFFAANGGTDPEAELRASADAMGKDLRLGRFKLPPQCAFPARYRFLKRELGLSVADVPCPKLEEFLATFDADSVSVVFSSAYANNPGSMFGHTFLKFNTQGRRPEILDLSIGYAAFIGADSGMLYMVRGVFGGYEGQFAVEPYYRKVNEYSNQESRDLWEYELSLTKDEVRTVIEHIWEIETNSYLQYYFFDENCAFILVKAIEAARPDWDFGSFGVYTIPGETIRRLVSRPGVVRDVRFRPSLRKKMLQHLSTLDSSEKALFWDLAEGKRPPSGTSSARLLDTENIYFQYLKQKNSGTLADADQARAKALLVRRAELPKEEVERAAATPLPPIEENTRPDLGHYPYRLGLSAGVGDLRGDSRRFQELSFKFAYHDLLNRDLGYMRNSQIDFPGIALRHRNDPSEFEIESVQAITITSLFPMNFLEKRLSWKLAFDYRTVRDFGCADCHVLHFDAGAGATLPVFGERNVAYAMFDLQTEYGTSLARDFRLIPNLEAAMLLNPFDRYKLLVRGTANYEWPKTLSAFRDRAAFYGASLIQSFALSESWEIRLAGEGTWPARYREGKLTANFYF